MATEAPVIITHHFLIYITLGNIFLCHVGWAGLAGLDHNYYSVLLKILARVETEA